MGVESATESVPVSQNRYLAMLCEHAKRVGGEIDLSGCGYGSPHWPSEKKWVDNPFAYYFFLAGLVRVTGARRILEIGTHCGGSIRSMMRGLPDEDSMRESCYVTNDLSFLNQEAFSEFPDNLIVRVTGDYTLQSTVDQICLAFDNQPIDLLFIDGHHSFEGTVIPLNTFMARLSPSIVVLDDIFLNEEMEQLWAELVKALGEKCYDATIESGRGDSGLGLFLTNL